MQSQDERTGIRIPSEEKEIIKQAAKEKRISLSEFMRRAALKDAQKVLKAGREKSA